LRFAEIVGEKGKVYAVATLGIFRTNVRNAGQANVGHNMSAICGVGAILPGHKKERR